jgi:hypothetical protein
MNHRFRWGIDCYFRSYPFVGLPFSSICSGLAGTIYSLEPPKKACFTPSSCRRARQFRFPMSPSTVPSALPLAMTNHYRHFHKPTHLLSRAYGRCISLILCGKKSQTATLSPTLRRRHFLSSHICCIHPILPRSPLLHSSPRRSSTLHIKRQ